MSFYVFTDFETTGLDANKDVILEAAALLVDVEKMQIVGATHSIIHDDTPLYTEAVSRAIFGKNQIVNQMHTKSGLWDAWNDEAIPHVTASEWAANTIEFFRGFGLTEYADPMAGNSIGSLDRPFALVHMKSFSDFLSYRNFDVSTLRMWIGANRPSIHTEWLEFLDNYTSETDKTMHRAIEDCMVSFHQWKFYTEKVFGVIS